MSRQTPDYELLRRRNAALEARHDRPTESTTSTPVKKETLSLASTVSTKPYIRAGRRCPSWLTVSVESGQTTNTITIESTHPELGTGRFWAAYSRRRAQGIVMRTLFDIGWGIRSEVSQRAARRASQGKKG